MKLRQRPGDFVVRERMEAALDPAGAYGLYRLTKRGVTTAAAVSEIARRVKADPRRIGVGGLKDAHAEAVQHVTIAGGPKGVLQGRGWRLEPVGRVKEPLQPGRTGGNAFEITVRDLSRDESETLLSRVKDALGGVPNYFDSQRFGSLAGGGGFAAKDWVLGRYEAGLKTILTSTYRGQEKTEREPRERLGKAWGDWKGLASSLPYGEARAVAMYLRDHPGAFSGAIRCLAEGTRWQALAAYQSHLFNEILCGFLRRRFPGGADVEIRSGRLYFPLSGGKVEGAWPLPRKGASPPPAECAEDYAEVMKGEGIEMEALKVGGARLTFPKGDRAAWVVPAGLEVLGTGPDEMNPGRSVVGLGFALPPGSYATVVVKRLTYDFGHTFRA